MILWAPFAPPVLHRPPCALVIARAPAMPAPAPTSREIVDRLDARHEELIQKLDELNARIEATLAEFARSRELPAPVAESRKAA